MVNNTGDEQYNGNIAAVKWNTPEFGLKAYGYGYDNINRLERAKFAAGAALNTDVDKYSVENITYDANGNILTLGRHNTAAGFIDNLTMTYDGNQLKKTHDSGDLALGFYDGIDAEIEYHYDFNGNMDVDDNKGFVFAYNYLNLPKEIVGGNDTVRYIYDANGVKLSKELVQSGAISYTDCVGNFVYKDGDLDYISTSEGRITEPTAGTIQYEYFLKDHLGNVRTVFADGNEDGILADNEVLQETHYYPYGPVIGDLAIDRGADNKLKFSGKELQDDQLNGVKLSLYDFEARFKMDYIPYFTTIDPHAESYFSLTPYNYCAGNPLIFIDPDGKDLKFAEGERFWFKVKAVANLAAGWLTSSTQRKQINHLIKSDKVHTIKETSSFNRVVPETLGKYAAEKPVPNTNMPLDQITSDDNMADYKKQLTEWENGKTEHSPHSDGTGDGSTIYLNLSKGGKKDGESYITNTAHEFRHGMEIDLGIIDNSKIQGVDKVTYTDSQGKVRETDAYPSVAERHAISAQNNVARQINRFRSKRRKVKIMKNYYQQAD